MRSVSVAAALTAACFFAMAVESIHHEPNAAQPNNETLQQSEIQALRPIPAPTARPQQADEAAERMTPRDIRAVQHEPEQVVRDDLHRLELERNAQAAAMQRAVDDARRRAIVQQRAIAAAQRRKARLAATEHLPIARPTVGATPLTPYHLPKPIVYWESPNYKPRDVDVVLIPD